MLKTTAMSIENAPYMFVTNGKEEIQFDIHLTTKRSTQFENLFTVVNQYQELLDPQTQDEIFRLLKEVKENKTYEYNEIMFLGELTEVIHKVAKLYNYKRFKVWFSENHKGLFIPEDTIETFIDNPDSGETIEKTYVKSQYVDFVGLILFVRMMFPFYNDYLERLQTTNNHPYFRIYGMFMGSDIDDALMLDYDPNKHKDLEDLSLGSYKYIGTSLTKQIDLAKDSDGNLFVIGEENQLTPIVIDECTLEKVTIFAKANLEQLKDSKDRQYLIMELGLSEDEVKDYYVAESIFDKLLTMDFFNSESNVISHVFQTLKYGGSPRKSGSPPLKTKASIPKGAGDERGHFENQFKSSKIPMGTIVELQNALNNEHMLLTGLGFDVNKFDWKMYEDEKKNMNLYTGEQSEPIKVYLLGWFYNSVISPRSMSYIEERRFIELLLLAKCCLYQSDQEYLGTFLSCYREKDSSYVNPSISSRSTLPKHLLQRLEALYKYSIEDKGVTTYEKTVIDFSKQITNLPWKPRGYNDENFINERGYLIAPSNVEEVIVDFIEYILQLGKCQQLV